MINLVPALQYWLPVYTLGNKSGTKLCESGIHLGLQSCIWVPYDKISCSSESRKCNLGFRWYASFLNVVLRSMIWLPNTHMICASGSKICNLGFRSNQHTCIWDSDDTSERYLDILFRHLSPELCIWDLDTRTENLFNTQMIDLGATLLNKLATWISKYAFLTQMNIAHLHLRLRWHIWILHQWTDGSSQPQIIHSGLRSAQQIIIWDSDDKSECYIDEQHSHLNPRLYILASDSHNTSFSETQMTHLSATLRNCVIIWVPDYKFWT